MIDDLNLRVGRTVQPYLFQNAFILTELPDKDLAMCQKLIKPERRKRGEVLFRQGIFPKGAFLLLSGKAKIFQQTPGGQRQTMYVYSEGDLIAYRQLIGEEPNPVSCILLEDAEVGFIPGESFRKMLDTSPFFARNVLTALAREFAVWMNRMTIFTQFPVRHRLILTLLILHEQYRRSGSPPGMVTITRTDLAEYVGASLETVVRTLNTLKSAGMVSIKGRSIYLPDPAGLVDILESKDI